MFPFFKTVAEAALPMNTSHDALRGHLRTALMAAHGVQNTYDEQGPWINDVFPGHVVYSHKGQTLKRSYTSTPGAAGADPAISVGSPKKVHVAYVSSAQEAIESMRVLLGTGEGQTEDLSWYKSLVKEQDKSVIITLDDGSLMVREGVAFCDPVIEVEVVEKDGPDGTKIKEAGASKTIIPICIIKPGWGSCAYYSKEMIQKTGPSVFRKNTQMFVNHATEAEEAQRPEGDVNNLAAVLTKDAYWNENGPKGPGLYSEAMLFPDHSEQILEKGPYIGCSINAAIKASEGSVEGRNGLIAEAFTRAYSVDYVTKAGAGGAPIVSVTESARGSAPTTVKESNMALTAEQEQALRDQLKASEDRIRAFEAQQNRILAVAAVGTLLKEAGFEVKRSLLERVCANPTMKEGKVDEAWAKAAAEDLVGVSESTGRVENLGERSLGVLEGGRQKPTDGEAHKDFGKTLAELGVSEAGMKYALGEF